MSESPTTQSLPHTELTVRGLFEYLCCFEDENTDGMTLAQVVREFRHVPAADIADAILEGVSDWVVTLEAVRAHFPRARFAAVAEALEVCPTHLQDAAICRDDRLRCKAAQR